MVRLMVCDLLVRSSELRFSLQTTAVCGDMGAYSPICTFPTGDKVSNRTSQQHASGQRTGPCSVRVLPVASVSVVEAVCGQRSGRSSMRGWPFASVNAVEAGNPSYAGSPVAARSLPRDWLSCCLVYSTGGTVVATRSLLWVKLRLAGMVNWWHGWAAAMGFCTAAKDLSCAPPTEQKGPAILATLSPAGLSGGPSTISVTSVHSSISSVQCCHPPVCSAALQPTSSASESASWSIYSNIVKRLHVVSSVYCIHPGCLSFVGFVGGLKDRVGRRQRQIY